MNATRKEVDKKLRASGESNEPINENELMHAIRNSYKIERQQGTKTRTRRTRPRIWPRLEDQEQSMHSMCTQTRYDANASDDDITGSPVDNHSFTARDTHAEKFKFVRRQG